MPSSLMPLIECPKGCSSKVLTLWRCQRSVGGCRWWSSASPSRHPSARRMVDSLGTRNRIPTRNSTCGGAHRGRAGTGGDLHVAVPQGDLGCGGVSVGSRDDTADADLFDALGWYAGRVAGRRRSLHVQVEALAVVPPKPQHSSAPGRSTSRRPRTFRSSRRGRSPTPSIRSEWQVG